MHKEILIPHSSFLIPFFRMLEFLKLPLHQLLEAACHVGGNPVMNELPDYVKQFYPRPELLSIEVKTHQEEELRHLFLTALRDG